MSERVSMADLTAEPLGDELSLDQHMLHCEVCASGDDACDVGLRLSAIETLLERDDGPSETLEEHRKRLHDPRNPEHEPCCTDCCDCSLVCVSDADDDRDWEAMLGSGA